MLSWLKVATVCASSTTGVHHGRQSYRFSRSNKVVFSPFQCVDRSLGQVGSRKFSITSSTFKGHLRGCGNGCIKGLARWKNKRRFQSCGRLGTVADEEEVSACGLSSQRVKLGSHGWSPAGRPSALLQVESMLHLRGHADYSERHERKSQSTVPLGRRPAEAGHTRQWLTLLRIRPVSQQHWPRRRLDVVAAAICTKRAWHTINLSRNIF